MNTKKILLFILTSSMTPYILQAANEPRNSTHHLEYIFSSSALKNEFAGFLENVLRYVDTQQFYNLAQNVQRKKHPQHDAEFYAHLVKKMHRIEPMVPALKKLQSLATQKKVLSKQALNLLENKKSLQGCLEIGTPATYTSVLRNKLAITGPIYVLNEQKKFSDFFQTMSLSFNALFPYDTFVPLNNYEPIQSSDIPSNSLDLVICFIGLHHIPVEKLDAFVASVARCMKPGGIFLLRDHDAKDDLTLSMVHAAHTVFNATIGNESLEAECKEYRNFQPLEYWIELLKKHGFEVDAQKFLQKGDPSLNTMMRFTKQASSPSDKLALISHELKENPDYVRENISTYLTTPEWYNVDISQEYGKFIEKIPFYEFPYMQSITSYWDLFAKSFKTAQKKNGTLSVITSPYTLMNLFIGCTMSVEYTAKSLLSLPIRALYSGQEPATIQLLVDDPEKTLDSNLPAHIILKEKKYDTYKLLEIPRYKLFLDTIKKFPDSCTIVEIAGHKEIQCKVRYGKNLTPAFDTINGCFKEYEWELPTDKATTYAAITIKVHTLQSSLKEFEKNNIEVVYIHDF
ncbi:MAG: methyltransferase domain-containing protein [Candidatus Babeliales bacterium]